MLYGLYFKNRRIETCPHLRDRRGCRFLTARRHPELLPQAKAAGIDEIADEVAASIASRLRSEGEQTGGRLVAWPVVSVWARTA